MSHRPIIDAGPGLNFFSINKERLLIGVLGQLSAPETVQEEVPQVPAGCTLPRRSSGLAKADTHVDADTLRRPDT